MNSPFRSLSSFDSSATATKDRQKKRIKKQNLRLKYRLIEKAKVAINVLKCQINRVPFAAYIRFLYRARWPLAIFFVALFAASAFQASHLKLKSDFKTLLPSDFQSVKDLDRIIGRVGGTGSLFVAVESDDPKASIRFAEDLVAKLKAYPPETINHIDYNTADVKAFFEANKYLYLNIDDLQEIHDRLDRRIQREKLKKSGLFIDFESKEEKDSEFSADDIQSKYKSKMPPYEGYIDGYFFGENGKLMALIIRPPGSATGIEFSKLLIEKVEKTIADLDPKRYHPSMRVGLAGNVLRTFFEYQTLINDIVSTAVLCIGLVGLVVFIYFRRLRMAALMAWAVLNGVAWIFALAEWEIGYLTTQTAFLGSIIIGNGINYSLILMARYLEERHQGSSVMESLHIAMPTTFWATLASSLTTSVGFGVLMSTDVRGFSQFGFIGGLGMFLCWIATYSVLPVFLSISEEIWPTVSRSLGQSLGMFGRLSKRLSRLSPMTPVTRLLSRKPYTVIAIGGLATVISIPLMIHFLPHSLEYDFSKLRVKAEGKSISQEATLNSRIRGILGGSMTPAVIVTDTMAETASLCDAIAHKNDALPPGERIIDSCKSIHSYVPDHQEEKLALLSKIRGLLEDNALDFLKPAQKAEADRFKAGITGSKPISLSDLPENIIAKFRETNGDLGKLVYVYPADKLSLWKKANLFRYTDIIRSNTLPDGKRITASGEYVIFADLIREIVKDGPRLTILSFLAICAVVLLIFRDRRGIAFMIGTLIVGVIWMGGLIAIFNIKINFFNFIAIPTTFGIGIDYAVNIYQRYKLESEESMKKALETTGGAVVLCSITTIIGYFTLIIARNQALVSFGWIGIIGEITCLVAAILFVPAVVMVRKRRVSG